MLPSEIKSLLFNPRTNKNAVYYQIKCNTQYESDFTKSIKAALTHPMTEKVLLGNPFPVDFGSLRVPRIIPNSGNFNGELLWMMYGIKKYSEEISAFLQLQEEFENSLFDKDFNKASQILVSVEEKFRCSFWLLENKILLKEIKDGTESNWSFASDLNKQVKDPLTLYFIDSFSKRVESNASYHRFNNTFINSISEIQAQNFIKEYFCFRLNRHSFDKFENHTYFLNVESVSSIIDRYLMLRGVLIDIVNSNREISLFLNNLILDLASLFANDKIISNLANCIDDNFLKIHDKTKEILGAIDLYSSGNYQAAIELSTTLISKYPSCVELYDLLVKSYIITNRDINIVNINDLSNKILVNLHNIISVDDAKQESIEVLLKTCSTYSSSSWAKQLLSLVHKYSSYSNEIFENYLYQFSIFTNPIGFQDKRFHKKKFEIFDEQDVFLKSLTYRINRAIKKGDFDSINNENVIPEPNKTVYLSRALLNSTEINSSHEFFKKINYTFFPEYYKEEVIRNLFYLELEEKNYRNALILYIDNYISKKGVVSKINTNKLVSQIHENNFENVSDLIDLPILFNLVKDESYEKYVGYDIFMSSIDLSRPTEIFEFRDRYSLEKIICFLKDVCTEEILHYSYFFEGSTDVLHERLTILKELLQLNNSNEAYYIKEITEINQALSIKKAIQEVNKGRISVNVQQLKNIEYNSFKEVFFRYQILSDFSKNKEMAGVDSLTELISEYLKTLSDEKKSNPNSKIKDPAYISFKSMFYEIRDKFLFSKEYGLDGYLSTRIRHGTFQNHIRSVFEKLNLLSKKNADGTYSENEYWNERLPFNLHGKRIEIQNCIKDFSKRIDDYTSYLIKEEIQIYTERNNSKPKSLFFYSFSEEYLWVIFNFVKEKIIDHTGFLDYIFRELLEYTQLSLSDTRKYFNTEVKEKYIESINQFNIEAKNILSYSTLPELTTNINLSITEIQNELQMISEWFQLSDSSPEVIIDIKTAIVTGIELTNTIHPQNKINPIVNVNIDLPFVGALNLIYITRILLDNILIHSGFSANELNIEIDVSLDNNVLSFSFKNNLSPSKNIESLRLKLDEIKLKMIDKSYNLLNINTEGNSGYDKIKRIFLYDLNTKNFQFDYHLTDSSVQIVFKIPNVKIQEIGNEE